jgi:hypothetical protein
MKRINPKTGNPFYRHDTRAKDNKLFFAYTNIVKRDGFFKEIWLTPDSMAKQLSNNAQGKRKGYVRRSDRLPRGSSYFFKTHPRAKSDYFKIRDELKADPSIPVEDLLEMLDSERHEVLEYLNITIPS